METPAAIYQEIIESARAADLVRFDASGVSVLQYPKSLSTEQDIGAKWDALIVRARAAGILKFCADGVAVLLRW